MATVVQASLVHVIASMFLRSCILLLVLALAAPAAAQGLFGASPHQPAVDDKTGTNPLNLQQQIDLSNTYITLDTLYLNTTTYRHAVPFFHRRVRVAGVLPIGFSNLTGSPMGGLGDVGADVEWTPWLSSRGGMVAGLRTTWHTATSDGLGFGGTHTLMPYAQFVGQATSRTLLAPFIAYRTGVGGDDFAPAYRDVLVGATAVWRASNRAWVSTTPQVVFDLEHDRAYGDVGVEVGYMLLDRVGTYVRPTVGFAANDEKPYGWGIAVGLRFVP